MLKPLSLIEETDKLMSTEAQISFYLMKMFCFFQCKPKIHLRLEKKSDFLHIYAFP